MKERVINFKDIRKFKPFNPCAHSESVLYIDKNEVLKILDPCFTKSRKETVEELSKIKHSHLITPLYSIIMDDQFSGYAMKYYKKYISLDKKIIDPSIPYKQRQIIAKQIWEILDFFKKINFSFIDLHEDNVIIDDEFDLQFLDLDSGHFKKSIDKDNLELKYASKRVCIMTLNILFGVRPISFYENFEKNESTIRSMMSNNQNILFERALSEPKEINGLELIDEFDEETVNNIKRKLKLILY